MDKATMTRKLTLDQDRAKFAWECASKGTDVNGYREMVKGASALIMGSGLMAAMAYWKSRTGNNKEAAHIVLQHTLDWLAKRQIGTAEFAKAMNEFFNASSIDYMRATDETLAMLKWLRQFADAIESGRGT